MQRPLTECFDHFAQGIDKCQRLVEEDMVLRAL